MYAVVWSPGIYCGLVLLLTILISDMHLSTVLCVHIWITCVSKCVYHVPSWCNAYTGVGSNHCLLKLEGLGIRHIHQLSFFFAACSHVLKRVTLVIYM